MQPANSWAGFGTQLRSAPASSLTVVLLLVLLVIAALTYDGYGFTMDEDRGLERAQQVIRFHASWWADGTSITHFDKHSLYGAMPDTLALLLQYLLPTLSLDSRHIVGGLFGIVGVYYAFRLGEAFVSPWTGFLTALFLAVNPMWHGHMFFNLKDVPFAVCLLAATYFSLTAIFGRYRFSWIWLKLGLAAGLLASTKLIGLPVLAFIVAVMLGCLLFIPAQAPQRLDRHFWLRSALAAAAVIAGSLVCLVLFWPQFYIFGPRGSIAAIRTFMDFEGWTGRVLHNGRTYPYHSIPWFYMTTYYAISMPLFLLVLTIVGGLAGIWRREPVIIGSLLVSVAFLAYQAVTGARVYNGYRHFLFLLPFVMLTAAYAFAQVLEMRMPKAAVIASCLVLGTCIVTTVSAAVQLFPYQYSFYNALVGGIAGAEGKYDIDPWRSALREGLVELDRIEPAGSGLRVYSCGTALNLVLFPRFAVAPRPEQADYIVAIRGGRCPPEKYDGLPVAAEVRRQGVLIAAVLRRGEPPASKPYQTVQ